MCVIYTSSDKREEQICDLRLTQLIVRPWTDLTYDIKCIFLGYPASLKERHQNIAVAVSG